MMHKALSVLAAGAIGLAVIAGCSGGASNGNAQVGGTTGGSAPVATGKKLTIGVSIPAADHGWTAGVKYWAEQAQKNYPNVEFKIQTADKPETQISQIETMMATGLDGLVILATESAPLTPVAKQAHERGIYLVSVDRGFTEPVADVFVEGDNKAFGRKSAQFIVDRLGGNGKVVIMEGIPSTVNTDRVNAALEVFKASPGIQIVAQQSGMWNRQKAQEVMQTILTKAPQIDAVWGSDDDMAEGIEQAIKEAGRKDIKWILGGAGKKEIIKRVMDGDPMYPGNITYPPSMIAVGMHMAATNLSAGKDAVKQYMPRHLVLDVDLVTKENAKDFYFPESIY
ncbi:MAG: ABC transporter substrate-binding protein [Fimbriimonas sp.]